MRIVRSVRDLHSDKPVQTLFCKVIVEDNKVRLESKGKDNEIRTIDYEDLVHQVNAAIKDAGMKPPK